MHKLRAKLTFITTDCIFMSRCPIYRRKLTSVDCEYPDSKVNNFTAGSVLMTVAMIDCEFRAVALLLLLLSGSMLTNFALRMYACPLFVPHHTADAMLTRIVIVAGTFLFHSFVRTKRQNANHSWGIQPVCS